MLSCEWECSHCEVKMESLANGITWCPSCGKVTSNFAPVMSQKMFELKSSIGEGPPSPLKVHYGAPSEKKTANLRVVSEE
jgi:hypothetical protein